MIKWSWRKRVIVATVAAVVAGCAISVFLMAWALHLPSPRTKVLRRAEVLGYDAVVATADVVLGDHQDPEALIQGLGARAGRELIRDLSAAEVRVRREGLYLVFRQAFVEEEGLFVLRKDSEFRPRSGGDPSYEPVAPRLYWYKIRG